MLHIDFMLLNLIFDMFKRLDLSISEMYLMFYFSVYEMYECIEEFILFHRDSREHQETQLKA